MVRTKADNCPRKAVAEKATRKVLSSSNRGGSSSNMTSPSASKTGRYAGGNPVCVRPTPEWQKGISSFMKKLQDTDVVVNGENQPDTDVVDETSSADCGLSQSSSSSSGGDTSTADGDNTSSHQCNGIIGSDKED